MGSAAFLSAGGYHHHIGLNTWESKDGPPPASGTTGLYHFAINYPQRKDLAVALKRLLDHGWSIDGASDHGTHEAIYLHDPDFNGIELAWDRHPSQWPRRDGVVTFSREPLDFASLISRARESQTRRDIWRSCRNTSRERLFLSGYPVPRHILRQQQEEQGSRGDQVD